MTATPTRWLRPYTDETMKRLGAERLESLDVLCPGFALDCLETLEEIGIRARDQCRAAGGQELELVPSLNATETWVDAVCAMVR